jgi:hypothetical protein
MEHDVVLSALVILLCASVSITRENASSGESVAKDLPAITWMPMSPSRPLPKSQKSRQARG